MKNTLVFFLLLIALIGGLVGNTSAADGFTGSTFSTDDQPKEESDPLFGNNTTFENTLGDGDETPPPFPEETTTEVPLDGGASLLLLAGAGIAVRGLRRKDKIKKEA